MRATAWMEEAACAGLDDLFSLQSTTASRLKVEAQRALNICAGCPVLQECSTWAGNYPWASVVVGGQAFGEPRGTKRPHGLPLAV